jgi:hypothetical protein
VIWVPSPARLQTSTTVRDDAYEAAHVDLQDIDHNSGDGGRTGNQGQHRPRAPVLVLKGNHHPDVDDWIEAGRDVAIEWSPPDTNLVYLAVLKQFYLAGLPPIRDPERSIRRSGAP